MLENRLPHQPCILVFFLQMLPYMQGSSIWSSSLNIEVLGTYGQGVPNLASSYNISTWCQSLPLTYKMLKSKDYRMLCNFRTLKHDIDSNLNQLIIFFFPLALDYPLGFICGGYLSTSLCTCSKFHVETSIVLVEILCPQKQNRQIFCIL